MEKDKVFGLPVHIDENMPEGLIALTNWHGETVGIMQNHLLTIDEVRELYPNFKGFSIQEQLEKK